MQWIEAKFQSARQIWVWPNNTIPSIVRCNRECFNLPGRFGFGRTADPVAVDPTARSFQSARQIWVWPNLGTVLLSIGQVIVFQSARQIWVWPNSARGRSEKGWQRGCFNLPGRFGFGRTVATPARSVLSQRFQSARQIWVWPNRDSIQRVVCARVRFNLPGRFGFGRTWGQREPGCCRRRVSICQADLGLAER